MTNGIDLLGFEALNITLGPRSDTFFIDSTPAGAALTLHGGDGSTSLTSVDDTINIRTIAGPTDDLRRRRQRRRCASTTSSDGVQTFVNGIGGVLTLHGGAGSDTYEIGLSGTASPAGPLTQCVFDDRLAGRRPRASTSC